MKRGGNAKENISCTKVRKKTSQEKELAKCEDKKMKNTGPNIILLSLSRCARCKKKNWETYTERESLKIVA